MNSIPNQPIIFRDSNELSTDCSCNSSGFSQLVDFSDVIYFQLESLPCRDSYLFGYDTFEAGWGVPVEGQACSTSMTQFGNYSVYFHIPYEYQLYEVKFRISVACV